MNKKETQQWALRRRLFEIETRYGEDLFSDMDLNDYIEELTCYDALVDGKWESISGDLPFVDVDDWRLVVVDDNGDYDGRCSPQKKLIEVTKSYATDDIVLLHELIHAYESRLAGIAGETYTQYVAIRLFDQLNSRIPGLISKMTLDVHRYNVVHTPLFLLKSFDLDLRCGLPLGTVYMYERKDMFREEPLPAK